MSPEQTENQDPQSAEAENPPATAADAQAAEQAAQSPPAESAGNATAAETAGADAPADSAAEQQPGGSAEHQPQRPGGPDTQEQLPDLPDFGPMLAEAARSSIELLNDVELNVKIELGRVEMTVDEILRLTNGSVVELDKLAGDPVDVLVNEQLVARGEVLVVNDNFCVRINEIVQGIKGSAPLAVEQ